MELWLLVARWLIAGIFLRSGLAKITGIAAFRAAVANYRLRPAGLVAVLAVALPVAEILAAVLLAAGVLTVPAALALAALLVAFAVAIGVNLAGGRVFDCGCEGSAAAPRLISWRQVAADIALATVAAGIAAAPPASAQLWPGPGGLVQVSTPPGGAVPAGLAACVCLVLIAMLRRAADVRGLAVAARRQLAAGPVPANQRSR